MKKLISLLLAVMMMLSLVACGGDTAETTAPESTDAESNVSADWMGADLSGVAGAVGGGWYSSFATFTDILTEKDPRITVKVSPGSGIGNSATIGEDTYDMGWVYPAMTQLALDGVAPYEEAYDGIRIVATGLSPQIIEVVARASVDVEDIDSIFENEQAISWLTPNKGSTTPALFFDIMLDYYGVSEDDIKSWGGSTTYTPYSDWSQLIQDGHADIMFNQGSMPFSTTQELAASTDLKLISIPDELRTYLADNYALTETVIPAGTYDFQQEDINTLQMYSGLGCSAEMDNDTVYRILEIIEANIDEFRAISPSFEGFSLETAWQNIGTVPLHPGAEQFYKDHGYMD